MTLFLEKELHSLTAGADEIARQLRAKLIGAEQRRIPLADREREVFGHELLRIKKSFLWLDRFIGEFENSSFNPGRYSEDVQDFHNAITRASNLLGGGLIKEVPRQEIANPALIEMPEPPKAPVSPSDKKTPLVRDDPLELTPKGLLIDMFISPERAPDMVFNLQQAFDERWMKVHGARVARLIFLNQSVGAILNFWTAWLLKRLKLLKLLGLS
jgi:hypothetical protein